MNQFSENSLKALGEYYVYGLIDPRTNKMFYIGKGSGNRVFYHEKEADKNQASEKQKLKMITEIKNNNLEVKEIIIHSNLTEEQAFAAEAALINAFNFFENPKLSNIVSGHHSLEALTVEEFEKTHNAENLRQEDIKHNLMIIKINKLYKRTMTPQELYDAVRGIWVASLKRVKTVDYVLGVYNSLVVAVFKPNPEDWFVFKDEPDRMKREGLNLSDKNGNRLFFVDSAFEEAMEKDKVNRYFSEGGKEKYYEKSIRHLNNQKAQNPITYLKPISK